MDLIKKEHILSAIKEIKDNPALRKGRASTTYDLMYEGLDYPPKLVVSIANRYATGVELDHNTFYGGPNKPAFNLLKHEGFSIVPKNDNVKEIIENYKKHIKQTRLEDEKYKWKLLKHYKGRPNLDSIQLIEEIKSINYGNLIYAMSKAVLYHLVGSRPENMRESFKKLFDESIDLTKRIKKFNEDTLKVYRELGETLQHHQDERTISTYLTFYNPDKYTFYKYSFYKKLCELLKVEEAKKNEKYVHYLELVNEIIEDYIQYDTQLINLVEGYVPEYSGSNNLLLVQDILYQMLDKKEATKKVNLKKEFINWMVANVSGGNYFEKQFGSNIERFQEEINEYEEIYKNEFASELFLLNGKDYKNQIDTINNNLYQTDTQFSQYSNNLATGRPKEILGKKQYLRFLNEYFSNESTMENETTPIKMPSNQILYGPPGTGKTYNSINKALSIIESKAEVALKLEDRAAIKKRFDDYVKSGQIVFTTFHQSMSYEDFIEGIKPETTKDDNVVYKIHDGILKKICLKASNFDYYVGLKIGNYIVKEVGSEIIHLLKPNAGTIVPIPISYVDELADLVLKKKITLEDIKNKTATDKMNNTVEKYIVNGYPNVFSSLVEVKIKNKNEDKKYVLIIDEINRGNVSAIFGELITLIETSKRVGREEALEVTLPYSKEKFSVPDNVYIIGTMNTADRSVEALDTALRRRFAFEEMMPDYSVLEGKIIGGFKLNTVLKTINDRVAVLLDRDHTIGHSYFINVKHEEDLKNTFLNNIIPLLQEYFYNDYEKIALVLGEGFVEIKDAKASKVGFPKLSIQTEKPESNVTYNLRKEINIVTALELLLKAHE